MFCDVGLNNTNVSVGLKMHENQQSDRVINHIKTEYGVEAEFLWPEKYPSYCVFRHGDNRKWFALVATISAKSLGVDGDNIQDDEKSHDDIVEIINLKFVRIRLMILRRQVTIFSGLSYE